MTPRWTRAPPLAAIVLGMLAAQLAWTKWEPGMGWERAHGQVFDLGPECVPASWPFRSGLPVCDDADRERRAIPPGTGYVPPVGIVACAMVFPPGHVRFWEPEADDRCPRVHRRNEEVVKP